MTTQSQVQAPWGLGLCHLHTAVHPPPCPLLLPSLGILLPSAQQVAPERHLQPARALLSPVHARGRGADRAQEEDPQGRTHQAPPEGISIGVKVIILSLLRQVHQKGGQDEAQETDVPGSHQLLKERLTSRLPGPSRRRGQPGSVLPIPGSPEGPPPWGGVLWARRLQGYVSPQNPQSPRPAPAGLCGPGHRARGWGSWFSSPSPEWSPDLGSPTRKPSTPHPPGLEHCPRNRQALRLETWDNLPGTSPCGRGSWRSLGGQHPSTLEGRHWPCPANQAPSSGLRQEGWRRTQGGAPTQGCRPLTAAGSSSSLCRPLSGRCRPRAPTNHRARRGTAALDRADQDGAARGKTPGEGAGWLPSALTSGAPSSGAQDPAPRTLLWA